jgi:probable F420-dependent oxidoreductase
MKRPFQFSVMSNGGGSKREVVDTAKEVEDLGYASLLYNDHYAGPGPAMEAAAHPPQQLAVFPVASLAAAVTTTLRIGFRVLCVDYHHPVVLAKQLATLDQLTDGRVEIGLGAGWIGSEYEAMGIPFEPPSVRIERLGEVIDLLRQSFASGPVEIDGTAGVQAHGYVAVPKPVQQPGPPIAIGGAGRRVLELAGRVADIVAFNVDNRSGKLGVENVLRTNAESTVARIDWIKQSAGNRFDDIELEIGAHCTFVTDDLAATTAQVAALPGGMWALQPDDLLAHPNVLIGDVDRICDTLEARREQFGFSRVTVLQHVARDFAPVVDRLTGR